MVIAQRDTAATAVPRNEANVINGARRHLRRQQKPPRGMRNLSQESMSATLPDLVVRSSFGAPALHGQALHSLRIAGTRPEKRSQASRVRRGIDVPHDGFLHDIAQDDRLQCLGRLGRIGVGRHRRLHPKPRKL